MKRLCYLVLIELALVGSVYLSIPLLLPFVLPAMINSDHVSIVALEARHPTFNHWQIDRIEIKGANWVTKFEQISLGYSWTRHPWSPIFPRLIFIGIPRGSIDILPMAETDMRSGFSSPDIHSMFDYLFGLPTKLAIGELAVTAPGITAPIIVSGQTSAEIVNSNFRVTLPQAVAAELRIKRSTGRKSLSASVKFDPVDTFTIGDFRIGPGTDPLTLEIFADNELEARGTLTLDSVEQLSSGIRVEGLSAKFLLTPERVSSSAPVRVKRVNFGTSLTSLNFNFNADASKFRVSNASAEFLNGRLYVNEAECSVNSLSSSFVLELEGISLRALNELRDAPNLELAGLINGSFPIVLDDGKVSINNGTVVARKPGGTIIYRDQGADGLASGDQSLALIVTALKNFHFDSLTAAVDYQTTGELTTAVALKGRNPDFQNGQRIDLNIKLEENILDLIRSLRLATDIDGKIGSKLQTQGRAPAAQEKVR